MPDTRAKGRVFFDAGGKIKLLDRVVRSGDEVRMTYYPTGTYSDEPITVMLRRLPDGTVGLHARVDRRNGQVEQLMDDIIIDQPAFAKSREEPTHD